jgi:hypothetical protein
LVSVILPVRNGAADLSRALDSILAQTFADFELIAINDGSSDETGAVLDGITDPRMRVVHQDNAGLPASLNRGIALARGRYIARQDHDDLARPTRLEQQVAFLERDPGCALIGTRADIWAADRPTGRAHDHPIDDAALRFELMFDNHFVHSSVMIRKSALDEVGRYATDPARQPPEDYELWSRLMRRHRVANLPERLTVYREVPGSLCRSGQDAFLDKLVQIAAENLASAVGELAPGRVHRDVAALSHRCYRQLSGDLDIEEVCRVVREAGARIHADAPGSDVPRRVAARIGRLSSEYRMLQTGLYRLRPLGRLMRRLGWDFRGRAAC